MEEKIRKNIIVILAISTVLLFVATISSCLKVGALSKGLTKGKETIFDLEKDVNAFKKDKSTVQEKLSSLAQELNEEKTAHQATKNSLEQEKLVNQSLKNELQKIIKLKEALEQDLKEALVAGKTERKK